MIFDNLTIISFMPPCPSPEWSANPGGDKTIFCLRLLRSSQRQRPKEALYVTMQKKFCAEELQ